MTHLQSELPQEQWQGSMVAPFWQAPGLYTIQKHQSIRLFKSTLSSFNIVHFMNLVPLECRLTRYTHILRNVQLLYCRTSSMYLFCSSMLKVGGSSFLFTWVISTRNIHANEVKFKETIATRIDRQKVLSEFTVIQDVHQDGQTQQSDYYALSFSRKRLGEVYAEEEVFYYFQCNTSTFILAVQLALSKYIDIEAHESSQM